VRSKQQLPLTTDERRLLEGFLAHEFTGVEALRVQAAVIHARKGCECGCGTIDLIPIGADLPRSDATSPVRVEGIVLDPNGAAVGGLLLFVTDGMLASLEVYAYDQPLPLPTIDRVRWNP
jgi:hypothetical protein